MNGHSPFDVHDLNVRGVPIPVLNCQTQSKHVKSPLKQPTIESLQLALEEAQIVNNFMKNRLHTLRATYENNLLKKNVEIASLKDHLFRERLHANRLQNRVNELTNEKHSNNSWMDVTRPMINGLAKIATKKDKEIHKIKKEMKTKEKEYESKEKEYENKEKELKNEIHKRENPTVTCISWKWNEKDDIYHSYPQNISHLLEKAKVGETVKYFCLIFIGWWEGGFPRRKKGDAFFPLLRSPAFVCVLRRTDL